MSHTDDETPQPPRKGNADPEYRRNRRANLRPFNLELSPTQRQNLRSIATHRGISMAAVLRQQIKAAYTMDCAGRPLCASGRQCLVPHLHPEQPDPQDL